MMTTVSVRTDLLIPKSDCSFSRYLWYLDGCGQYCREWVDQWSRCLEEDENCYLFVPARLATRVWAHCQYDVFFGKKRGGFSTLPYHSSSHCFSIGSFCSRTCCCDRIWSPRRLHLVSGTSTLPFSSLLLIYVPFCDSVTFQCLQNARYMPSAEPADSGHCPSDNLSRPAGFPTKNP
jgi:hypothetical protein